MDLKQTDDENVESLDMNRRTYIGLVALGLLDFSLRDAILGPDESKVIVDEADDRGDYDEDRFDLFVAEDTAEIFVPDEDEGGWKKLESTGASPVLDSAVIDNLRTKNIGVSAAVGTDQTISTGTETRMALSKTSTPYFDDFGELDSTNNKIVLEYGSHHEIVAHGKLKSASAAGQIWLRIYVNDVQRASDHVDVKNAEEGVLEASIYLKLDAGDVIEIKLEHDTGSDETFVKDENFASVVRQ